MASSAPRALTVLRTDASDGALRAAVETMRQDHPRDPVAAAALAEILAASGEQVVPPGGLTATIASTGGPSSLSTMLTPLFLRAAGVAVSSLGVPGRPAGGVDCLAQVRGYRVELRPDEVASILRGTGYAHFLASAKLAPLDARMFQLRKQTAAQSIPSLVAASILAKQIVAGARRLVLEVRVAPDNNFGGDFTSAAENARMFVCASRLVGIETIAVLTDGRFPYQPYIGRSEALVALAQLFSGTESAWLAAHNRTCRDLAIACLPAELRPRVAQTTATALRNVFYENLRAQGADGAAFEEVVEATLAAHVTELTATRAGFTMVPLGQVREVLVSCQQKMSSSLPFPDPAGVVLLHEAGTWVERGTPVATIRCAGDGCVATDLYELLCTPTDLPHRSTIEAVDG